LPQLKIAFNQLTFLPRSIILSILVIHDVNISILESVVNKTQKIVRFQFQKFLAGLEVDLISAMGEPSKNLTFKSAPLHDSSISAKARYML
jgi:hypothetical protein